MGNQNQMDLGGLDLVVNGLYVGATEPGQAGTALAGSELTLIDGITAGTVTASKAVVVDASKDVGDFNILTAAVFNFPAAAATGAGTKAGANATSVSGPQAFDQVVAVTLAGVTGYIGIYDDNA